MVGKVKVYTLDQNGFIQTIFFPCLAFLLAPIRRDLPWSTQHRVGSEGNTENDARFAFLFGRIPLPKLNLHILAITGPIATPPDELGICRKGPHKINAEHEK
jgi:hypothetical protein